MLPGNRGRLRVELPPLAKSGERPWRPRRGDRDDQIEPASSECLGLRLEEHATRGLVAPRVGVDDPQRVRHRLGIDVPEMLVRLLSSE